MTLIWMLSQCKVTFSVPWILIRYLLLLVKWAVDSSLSKVLLTLSHILELGKIYRLESWHAISFLSANLRCHTPKMSTRLFTNEVKVVNKGDWSLSGAWSGRVLLQFPLRERHWVSSWCIYLTTCRSHQLLERFLLIVTLLRSNHYRRSIPCEHWKHQLLSSSSSSSHLM